MMSEVLIVSSNKDGCGLAVIDVSTGSSVCSNFKNCIADPGTLCNIGSSGSSYSGQGSCGDYIAVAQSKKPVIHVWQWGKPTPLYQCHVQEIVTTLCSDSSGTFLVAGTGKGWIYCWNLASGELINIWQAHFKAVSRLHITNNGQFCISASEDGMARAWDLSKVLDISERIRNANAKQAITPYKSWSSHTLAVKDMHVIDTPGLLRVFTCSSDRSIVLYDVHAGKQVLRVTLPHSLESMTCNPSADLLVTGATNGTIFVVDLAVTAIGVSAAHSQIGYLSGSASNMTKTAGIAHSFLSAGPSINAKTASGTTIGSKPETSTITTGGLAPGVSVMEGHTKSVTALCFSVDNTTMLSTSEDGTVRMWDIWTRQCVRECKPFNKIGITNALILTRPEIVGTGVVKPSLCPVQHLKKYIESSSTTDSNGNASIILGAVLLGNHDVDRDGGASFSTAEFLQMRRKQQSVSESFNAGAADPETAAEESETGSSTQQAAVTGDKKRKRDATASVQQQPEEDFMAFSSTVYDPVEHSHDFSEEEEEHEEDSAVNDELQKKLLAADMRIAELQQMNSRLDNNCTRFRALLEQQKTTSSFSSNTAHTASAAEKEEEEDIEDDVRDVGDAPEIVNRIHSANSGKGNKKDTAAVTKKAGKAEKITPAAAPVTENNSGKKRKLPSQKTEIVAETATVVEKKKSKVLKK